MTCLVTLGILLGLGAPVKEMPRPAEGQSLDGHKPGPLLRAGQLKGHEPDPLEVLLPVLLAQVQASLLAIVKVEVAMDSHLLVFLV